MYHHLHVNAVELYCHPRVDDERELAKRQRFRAGNEETAAIDTSALFESVKKIAQLVAGPSEVTGAAEAALQAACAALGGCRRSERERRSVLVDLSSVARVASRSGSR